MKTVEEFAAELVQNSRGARNSDYRAVNGALEFRPGRSSLWAGLVCLLITAAMGVAALFLSRYDRMGVLVLGGLFSALGIPVLLFHFIERLWLDDKKLVRRNALGARRTIYLRDIQALRFLPQRGHLLIQTSAGTLKLSPDFDGLYIINSYLGECCALSEEAAFAGEPKDFRNFPNQEGYLVFKGKKGDAVIGLILVIFAIGVNILMLALGWKPWLDGTGIVGIAGFTVFFIGMGVAFSLPYLRVRLYISAEKIVYRNVLGKLTTLRWQEIDDLRYRGSLIYREQFILYGAGRRICISMFFNDYNTIEMLHDKYHSQSYQKTKQRG